MSLATANEISIDAAVAVVLSQVDGTFTLNEEQRRVLKGFLGGENIFALLPTVFLQEFSKIPRIK